MSGSQQDTIDFTVMYATHDALRRDAGRLLAAATAGKSGAPQVRAGWENFKAQLLLHHSVEDSHLWPPLRTALSGRPDGLALAAEMEAEHNRLDPLLETVDRALAGRAGSLPEHVQELAEVLGDHLKHEEESGLPLIQSVLTAADWRGFTGEMRRRQGIKGASVYVPWILDGSSAADQGRFLGAMPPPVRVLNRVFWERRYQQRNLWKV